MQAHDKDETRSWVASALIMEVATAFTVTMRILGVDPFTTLFDVFMVYVPTIVLVNSILYDWV
ncbi:MAG TPA: hypothetical protein VE955_03625, partial [Candidatus Dormibacteraeota bacterium]|nr:hypothetical protein [Candidatus Dormibacteraeota bacterium]